MKWHYTYPGYQTFGHPITIALIGVGGTGSNLLIALARMNHAMINVGMDGIHVTAWDPDVIAPTNPGRQIFYEQHIGMPKASTLISMVNRSFRLSWNAYDEKASPEIVHHNIVITCLDNWDWRKKFVKDIEKKWKQNNGVDSQKNQYWLDIGNENCYGQVVLGSAVIAQPKKTGEIIAVPQLATVFDLAKKIAPKKKTTNPGPSCSMAEALARQDLFINHYMAVLSADMLWQLLSRKVIDYNVIYFNNSFKQITTKLYEKNLSGNNDAVLDGPNSIQGND
jgi:PRTRC genetic system ThiF family protein